MQDREDIYWDSFLPAFFDRMSTMMRNDITAVVSDHGLTSAHAIYLVALKLQNGQTLVGLSRFLDLDAANTNRVIKVLRSKGLVYDDRKTESSRKYSIFLTPEGKSLADDIMESTAELNDRYLEGISREDVLQMRNTMVRMMMNMNPGTDGHDDSRYEGPFYDHLHMMPLDGDPLGEPAHITDANIVPRRTARRRRIPE